MIDSGESPCTALRLMSSSGNSHNVITEFSFQYLERGEGGQHRVIPLELRRIDVICSPTMRGSARNNREDLSGSGRSFLCVSNNREIGSFGTSFCILIAIYRDFIRI
jgi:hypothetical protein